jgi:hypothetical protein
MRLEEGIEFVQAAIMLRDTILQPRYRTEEREWRAEDQAWRLVCSLCPVMGPRLRCRAARTSSRQERTGQGFLRLSYMQQHKYDATKHA